MGSQVGGHGYVQRVWWEVRENPVRFLVMGSSLGEDVTSSSLGLSHEGRLFLLVLGPLFLAHHLSGSCPTFPKTVFPALLRSPMFLQQPNSQGYASPHPYHPCEVAKEHGANDPTHPATGLSSWVAWL